MASFVVMVPVAFIVAIVGKYLQVDRALQEADRWNDDCDHSLVQSFRRLQLGLADEIDHRLLESYVQLLQSGAAADSHVRAGRLLWSNKSIVTHLNAQDMADVLCELEIKLRLSRTEELAFHFVRGRVCCIPRNAMRLLHCHFVLTGARVFRRRPRSRHT